MVHHIRSLLIAAAFTLGASAGAQVLEIGGSSTVKDAIDPVAPALAQATGVQVKTVAMGTGRGMLSLFEGKTQMAAISESLDEALASARKTMADGGTKVNVPSNLVYHELSRQSVAIFVHKDNPLQSLTKAQLKDLFTGKVRNWKEIGGADAPVKINISSPGSATRATFQKIVLDGAEYAGSATEFRTSVPSLVAAGKDLGGIAMGGASLLNDAKAPIRIVQAPPVERPLALVTLGKPSEPAQKVIDYLRAKK